MLHQVIMKSLYAYLLLAVISFFVAVVIKVIVGMFDRAADKNESSSGGGVPAASTPVSSPASANIKGIPTHHLLAIISAAQMVAGGRIVRIDETDENRSWTTIGRSQHLASHDVRR